MNNKKNAALIYLAFCLGLLFVLALAGCSEKKPSELSTASFPDDSSEETATAPASGDETAATTPESRTDPGEAKIGLLGGQLYLPDFAGKYVEVYVKEGFVYDAGSVSPHSYWKVTDESLRTRIIILCGKIRRYREFDGLTEYYYGSSSKTEYEPSVLLVTDEVIYSISVVNWESDTYPPFSPIYKDRYGETVFRFFRYDRSVVPEEEPVYTSLLPLRDSLNGRHGSGWYSLMDNKQQLDELLELLRGVGPENAEEVAYYE